MANISSERFRTGNRVKVFASGDGTDELLGEGIVGAIGDASSADFNTDTGVQPVYVLGEPKPQELVDGRYAFTITLALLQLVSRKAQDLVNAGPVRIETVDKYNNNPIAVASGCKLASARVNLPANTLTTRNLTFQALDILS